MSLSTAAPSRSRLYYVRRGSGPLLLLIGSPMDSGFAPLASALADRYTVVTYDPRGIANSSREDTSEDVTPAQQTDDVHRLLSALGGGPADVLGSSGGALLGLALVTAHPDQLRTLVAHEPPLVELLADAARLRAEIQNIYDTYRVEGADKAMQKFLAHAGLGAGPAQEADAPRWEPSPERLARMRATTDQFLAHLLRPTTRYRPDIGAVRPRPRPGADRKDLSRRLRCKLRSRGRVAGAVRLHARLPPCRRFVGAGSWVDQARMPGGEPW
jgi:pimeloyl-ACP methyl ester carboxylesterase